MAGVYSVAQVNSYIKNMFTQDFALQRISVKGEVSNCKYHTSGHIYFTIKDETGTLAAVMFSGKRNGLSFDLKEGQQVIVSGNINVYERDGRYQLYANQIELDGAGDLFRRFQALRDSLEEMGMFAPEYKREIPRFASRIGVVTAPTGAAIRDIMNISHRRNPFVQLYLYPALVQGDGAVTSITKGIQVLDSMGLDVIIVGRGGGSIEDLWAFNEEAVARAIFACKTPVISAVGHETDVTIADYVADLRAPTPSAAAELAVFDYGQFAGQIEYMKQRLDRGFALRQRETENRLRQIHMQLELQHPNHKLLQKQQYLSELWDRMEQQMQKRMVKERHRLALYTSKLEGASPLQKVTKGYAFVTGKDGKRLDSVKQAEEGDLLTLHLLDGQIQARVESKRKAKQTYLNQHFKTEHE